MTDRTNDPDRLPDDALADGVADGAAPHVPVMLAECLEALAPAPGRVVVDGTFGAGGHARALLAAGADVVAIDQDPLAAEHAERLAAWPRPEGSGSFRFLRGNFRRLDALLADAGIDGVDGVLLDIGVSSMQLDRAEKGFAFRHDGPLDMRMSDEGESAADVVNRYEEAEIAEILYRLGEERYSRRIARGIVASRPYRTTGELAEAVRRAYPPGRRREHPARRTFQALRIHVNDELGALADGLEAAARALSPGGRLAVLSYHSLEDRIVKRFVRGDARLRPLTKKPVVAAEEERAINPRARSAKLRAAERLEPEALEPEAGA